jgi:superfamily II DNA or RNA helicase
MTLRPYQLDFRDRLRAAFAEGHSRVLGVSPTGSGKTVIFANTVKGAVERGNSCVVIAHRSEILDQISRALSTIGVKHGFIQAGKPYVPMPVMVASIQTLARRVNSLPQPKLTVWDEAHHCVSSQYMTVLAAWSEAKVLGVTATPERLDGRGLGTIFTSMVLGPSTQWLIDNRFLARPIYFAPQQQIDMSGIRTVAGDYSKGDLAELMDTPKITGDAVAHYRRYAAGKPAIAFCVTVKHAEDVAAGFRAAGFNAASIDGSLEDNERRQRVKDLQSGAIQVMTSCELVSEGFDLPAVSAAILLRHTKSLSLHLQQIGRALRPKPDGGPAVILDHVGNCLRHGLAEEQREWSLEGRTARKAKEKPVETKQCKKCYAMFAGAQCPQCGHVNPVKPREIETADGELKQLDPEEIKERLAARRQEGMCKSLADFQALAKARGYKPGWAYHRWQARQGKQGKAAA